MKLPNSHYPEEESSSVIPHSSALGLRTPETLDSDSEATQEATQRLYKLCQQSVDCELRMPDPAAIQSCVEAGADVSFRSPYSDLPILHDLVQKGYVACVAACLKTPRSIDFNTEGEDSEPPPYRCGGGALPPPGREDLFQEPVKEVCGGGRAVWQGPQGMLELSPCVSSEAQCNSNADEERATHPVSRRSPSHWSLLHCVLLIHSATRTTPIVELLVRRLLETHPYVDYVDWRERDRHGRDFISNAVYYQRLSYVWPVIKKIPYFRGLQKPIKLPDGIYSEDWNRLKKDDRTDFQPFKVIGQRRGWFSWLW